MPFWPLVLAFIAANYYSIWRKRWYLIVAFSIFIYIFLKHQASSLGVGGTITWTLATLIFAPLIFIIVKLLYQRWR
jgi:hypothetical protein